MKTENPKTFVPLNKSVLILTSIVLTFTITASAQNLKTECCPRNFPRQRLLMDFDWRFHRGDIPLEIQHFKKSFGSEGDWKKAQIFNAGVTGIEYDDSKWPKIDLPHDFVIEGPFVESAIPRYSFLLGDIAWYRKSFLIPKEDSGKRIYIEFDGVYRNCKIYFNGFYLDRHLSGYSSFRFDVTDFVYFGDKNSIAVRVDARDNEGWWYEGGGINRHVWLVKTDPLHIAPWGIFVHTQMDKDAKDSKAKVIIQSKVLNRSFKPTDFKLVSAIIAPTGEKIEQITTAGINLPQWSEKQIEQTITVSDPCLWSPKSPKLYKLITSIYKGSKIIDRCQTTFGIRTFYFDKQNRFVLNGKPTFLKGVNCHQHHAGLGVALPDYMHDYRLKKLKDMGCNAYRCSHYPPSPQFLDACDRLGLIVIDEHRVMNSSDEAVSQLKSMILRDRNHPSIMIWSLGNEEFLIHPIYKGQSTETAAKICATLKQITKKLDPTRPVTVAMNNNWGEGFSKVVDIQGCNYLQLGRPGRDLETFRKKFPNKPIIFTEFAAIPNTRGIYEKDEDKCYIPAYGKQYREAFVSIETEWTEFMKRPYITGAFVWTGHDFRGNPEPYKKWPATVSQFGVTDLCCFPKDGYYYLKSQWSDKTALHILPHWNWLGKEEKEIDVWCYSNLDEVELFLNGNSLGRKKMQRYGHLSWQVNYTPGFIEAKGYKNGALTATKRIETTGTPHTTKLILDRSPQINADRTDLAIVNIAVIDSEGRIVPTADNHITFTITGPGKIIGVGNGNPSSTESDKANHRRAFNGLCQVIIQTTNQFGTIELKASSPELKTSRIKIDTKPCLLPTPWVPSI